MNVLIENLNQELSIFILSMMPISELRGAIPLGIGMGMPAWKVYIIAVLGNILPVPILLKIFRPAISYIARTRYLRKFSGYVVRKIDKGSEKIVKYELLGLLLLVAIPLPTTGAWTGCGVASFLKLDYMKSFIYISLGVMVAGLIVLLLSFVGFSVVPS
ncbi:MAG: small multi-drug export protein [Tissierellales bacterium]|nr:small multi-drug export protein [Tissierellales bacterium]MBN2828619.1 small multi-drug export protein [Tissierellales bacterium]